jgi:hypothetical protein
MFRATFCPSSGALLNCSRSLRFPYKSWGGCVTSRGLFVSGETTHYDLYPTCVWAATAITASLLCFFSSFSTCNLFTYYSCFWSSSRIGTLIFCGQVLTYAVDSWDWWLNCDSEPPNLLTEVACEDFITSISRQGRYVLHIALRNLKGLCNIPRTFLFRCFGKIAKSDYSFVMPVRPSVLSHEAIRLPLNKFLWNCIFYFFVENVAGRVKFH